MKTITTCLFFLFTLSSTVMLAQEEEFPDAQFFVGSYTLIGKALNSETTFLGVLTLSVDENGAGTFDRRTGQASVRGSWGLEYAIGNEVRVVRIRWEADGTKHECTYQWCMDFDSYPRLSGHCYESGKYTDNPGMEVGFYLHPEYDDD
ncbi:MAG: hypothetical protein M5R41_11360 [Bacteroidia bacterium]|nr:hypothetical protein [Bacteroidia bacterium]